MKRLLLQLLCWTLLSHNVFAVCSTPTALTTGSITSTSVSLNWTQTGTPIGWEIKYGAPGFAPATAGTAVYTIAKPYTLNGLTASTNYEYCVRAVCAPGDTSSWSAAKSFTTLCAAPPLSSYTDSGRCGAGTVVLLASAPTGATLKWYANATGGTALGTGASFTTPSISATTTYYVAASNATCEGPRQAVVASVHGFPTVNIGRDTTICPGVSYVLDAGNPGASYEWNTGASTKTISVNAVGFYSVIVTNSHGCSQSHSVLITPGAYPTNPLPPTTDLCDGDVITLNAGNNGCTFNWSTGATSQTINVHAAGMYNVAVKSIDGCVRNLSTNVIARSNPISSLRSDTAICSSAQITLDAGNTGCTYLWSTNENTKTINTTDSGTYSVLVTTVYGCTLNESVHIAYLPDPYVEGFNFVPYFHGELGTVKFSPLNPSAVLSYEWDFGDGSPISTEEDPQHTYASPGYYWVKLKVFNICSEYETSLRISVDDRTGIDNTVLGSDILLYPNPAQDVVHIENKDLSNPLRAILVHDLMGRTLYSITDVPAGPYAVSTRSLAAGTYTVLIVTDKGKVARKLEVIK